ncbi:N,N-dimethylformamidase beta subunit family domain-containing protein [Sphaerospermopsis sp. LEGE 08334]|uniref:N,N-dimethylformamidase beta subunit family domain-containing protein n=1 Tax=Sphaerospermopsis sp. LEGE 08334 TaxID=1828651 RepID=UPI00187FCBB6|nr:N,N-dimethylformamidase beta subunit family domain-containing protein [Sphaerospermopsis sp. LEGE 08334]MBE9055501.1 Ig domain-containing protein group 1 domain-containing protein [Sphaerospermopsis sp. LEGE 08334]
MISLQPEHKSYDSTVNLLNRQQEEGSYLVFLRGSATVGHYLTAGIFDNDGLSLTGVTINYQWQQSVNGNWIDIVGETAQSLTLTNSLLGQQVRVLASYIDAFDRGKYVTSSGVTVAAQNAIVLENQKAGTTAWKITNLATNDEITGYGDATSINKGQALNLKISLAQAGQYRLDVYRLGYYDGKGGRLITSVTDLNGVTQTSLTITNASTNLVECKWNTSYTLQTDTDWNTGLYLVKLTDSETGKQNYIQFVLRDDNRPADLGFQDAVTTAQAYNNYGGYSVYDATSIGGKRAYQVSFDRPYAAANLGLTNTDGYNCNNMLAWEYNMTRWLESQGYDVVYYTNLDASINPLQLYSHNIFLSVGHDEYWSLDERNNVQKARDNGINLASFSANTAYWQIRFDPSSSGQANRVMTIYKDISGIGTAASIDPIAQTNPVAATTLFRSPEVNRPENALLGVGYVSDHGNIYRGYDFVVSNAADPYYANTGLKNGDKLRGLVGYEWDALLSNGFTPPGLVVLSQSPVQANSILPPLPPGTNPNISNAVRYTAASGAKVFSTGSIQWVWGLDSDWVVSPPVESVSWFRRIKNWLRRMKNWLRKMKKLWIFGLNSPKVTNPRVDSRAQQIAVNVFADMGAKPQTPSVGIVLR